ncbi:putative mRNA (2'-O-methyladenosine-N(6)-)-methyltransferase [Helianthus annuus]|nr:putative mRNA (2'-O-methyladenosine-N(6)-)-methyltransferase [Helianthus annuus]
MGSPERVKGHVKRDIEDSSGGRDDEAWEADERRKRRSGKSKQPGSGEENEGGENNGRKEKSESRKRPGGASKAVSEEDDYESRKESRAKQMKKKQEESALESLSNWYQDGDGENRHDGGERSERRKSTSKLTGRESSQSRSKVKDERMHDVELPEKDTRKEGRNPRKRWDDANIGDKVEESKNYAEKYDKKTGHGEGDKNLKYHEKDEKRSETDDTSGKEKVDTAERSYNADENEVDEQSAIARNTDDQSVEGMPPNILGPGFNPLGPMGRGQQQDKGPGGWVPPRNNGPPGKAPSRGEQNDYSQNFVDTGMRPQNFIRELELTSVVEDYPKLRELIQKKDEIVANSASAPMYYKCDLREHVLSPEFFGTKFDVILVDPPWEEYVHRAPGVTDHMDYWTFEEIMNLKIEAIADTPCFVFLWVGDGVGLEQGRQCLKKWGFRRCEDICWVKTNKTTATPGLRHDSHTLFQRSKEHCLMGIKGTVRRSTDGHIIHANIDTDVIIAEEPPYGSTAKPEDMYRIIEHFSLGRRRLELFGEDHNIRAGWLTVGKDLSSSNFNSEGYIRNFADKDGKVWQGGGGRNPPPEAGHLVLTTPDIEALRPKSPMKNQLQMQQQSQQTNTISLTPGSGGGNKRPGGNDPLSHNGPGMNQEASSSNISGPVPWGPPMGGVMGGPNEGFFDNMYGYNGPFGPMGGEFMDFETQRAMNNMM